MANRNQKLTVITYFPDPQGTRVEDGVCYKRRDELTPEEHARWRKINARRLADAIAREIQKNPDYGRRLIECGAIHD